MTQWLSFARWTVFSLVLAASAGSAATATPAVSSGRQLVKTLACTTCHQQGGLAPALSAYAGKPPDALKAALIDPKKALGPSTMMPSYGGGKLSPSELDAVVVYLEAGGRP